MFYIIYFILSLNILFSFDYSINKKSIENLKKKSEILIENENLKKKTKQPKSSKKKVIIRKKNKKK